MWLAQERAQLSEEAAALKAAKELVEAGISVRTTKTLPVTKSAGLAKLPKLQQGQPKAIYSQGINDSLLPKSEGYAKACTQSVDVKTNAPLSLDNLSKLPGRQQIRLNVGGQAFTMDTDILTCGNRGDGSLLAAICAGQFELDLDDQGRIFLDRDPEVFAHVLDWLRLGYVNPGLSNRELHQVYEEAEYLQLPALAARTIQPSPRAVSRSSNLYCSLEPSQQAEPSKQLETSKQLELTPSTDQRLTLTKAKIADIVIQSQEEIKMPSLAGFDLREAAFTGQKLSAPDFRNAMLAGVSFEGAILSAANFSGADLTGASLKDARCQSASAFREAKMVGVCLQNADLSDCVFTGAQLEGCDFTVVKSLKGSDLSHCDLRNCKLKGIDLSNVNLTGARLDGCDMGGVILHKTVLAQASLEGTQFLDATLFDVDFSLTASMAQVSIRGGSLKMCKFDQADLHGASFEGTFDKLEQQPLSLAGCTFARTNLQGATLSHVANMLATSAQLEGATLVGQLHNCRLAIHRYKDLDLSQTTLVCSACQHSVGAREFLAVWPTPHPTTTPSSGTWSKNRRGVGAWSCCKSTDQFSHKQGCPLLSLQCRTHSKDDYCQVHSYWWGF